MPDKETVQKTTRERWFLLFLLASSSVLLLTHLTHSYLWNDECSTAVIARTVLQHGVPMCYDGENSISSEEGRDITPSGIFTFLPWMQYYVTAAAFAALGESTFAARLPFALFGIATIMLTYYLALATWRSRKVAATASVMLMMSVPFLLLAGQCRYYSLSAFFTVLGLWNYLRLLESRKYAQGLFVVAALALLHTNHGHGVALLMSVAFHALIWHRHKMRIVLALVGGVFLLNLPWLIWMSVSHPSKLEFGKTIFAIRLFCLFFLFYIPNPFVLFSGMILVSRYKRLPQSERISTVYPGFTLALTFMGLSIPLMAIFVDYPYFRYLSPLLPVASVIAGQVMVGLWQRSKGWAVAVCALWFLTGLFPLYLIELTQDYKGPIRGIVTYLNEHAKPGETVAIGYEDPCLKFYTKLRVLGGYTGEDLAPAKQAKWVIPRKYGNQPVRDYLLREVPLGQHYKRIVLDGYPDVPYENRESPHEHRFFTDKEEEPVVIYERID